MVKHLRKLSYAVVVISLMTTASSTIIANAATKVQTEAVAASKASSTPTATPVSVPKSGKVKNVIILMGDGMSSSATTAARWVKGAPLALDEIVTGAIKTYNLESIITDSAPAGTALATGYKTDDKYISVGPSTITVPSEKAVAESDQYKPLASILEASKLSGRSTGIVATSQVQHASPAAFTSHNVDRNDYEDIGEQQVYQKLDVVLGGGMKYINPGYEGKVTREDGEDLVEELKTQGYDVVENRDAMLESKSNKLWGAFAGTEMSYDIDRDKNEEPSLSEMTTKAIDVLSKNKNGFFLFVEGSKIDWAGHANDPIGLITDTIAFDSAVKSALDFAKKDKDTLVIALSDHSTGGMSIGNRKTDNTYSKTSVGALVSPLKKAPHSEVYAQAKIVSEINESKSNLKDLVSKYYGISDLTDTEVAKISAELDKIKAGTSKELYGILGPMISERSVIGWSTGGHTGEDVPLYSYGPEKITGLVDNTDIPRLSAEAMGISLDDATKKLFVDIKKGLSGIQGLDVELDETDEENVVLVVTKGKNEVQIPLSTSKMIINGKTTYLNGVALKDKKDRIYIPQQAIDIIKNLK